MLPFRYLHLPGRAPSRAAPPSSVVSTRQFMGPPCRILLSSRSYHATSIGPCARSPKKYILNRRYPAIPAESRLANWVQWQDRSRRGHHGVLNNVKLVAPHPEQPHRRLVHPMYDPGRSMPISAASPIRHGLSRGRRGAASRLQEG